MAKTAQGFIKKNARVITIVFSVILVFVSVNAFWIANNFYNSERFADKITAVLQREDVRLAIGDGVAGQLYDDNPVLSRVLSDPTRSLVSSLLASDQFQQIFNNLAENLNEYIIQAEQKPVVIDLTGVVGIVQNVAGNINPERERIVEVDELKLVLLEPGDLPNFRGVGIASLLIGPYALLMLIIIFIVAWRKVASKVELARLVGLVFTVSAAAILIVAWTQATILNAAITTTNGQTVIRAIYDSFAGNLYSFAIGLGVVGLLLMYAPKCWAWYKKRA